MHPELSAIVSKVQSDTVNGASDVSTEVAAALIDLFALQSMPSRQELEEFALQLHAARRSMAPLASLAQVAAPMALPHANPWSIR